MHFTRSFCPALLQVFGSAPIPSHVFGKYTVDNDPTKNIDTAPENAAPAAVSGPFKFKEWRKGDQVILSRNDGYWRGAPYLDEFVQKVVADSTVQAAQLKTGELTLGAIQPGDYDDLSKSDNLKLYEWKDNGYVYIGWRLNNPNVPFLQDKRIRQALAYGLDMSTVVQSVVLGHGEKQLYNTPSVSWAYPGTAGYNDYKFDAGKAEQLIKDAGYTKGSDGFYAKDGKTLGWTIVTNQGNKTRETFLQVAAEQYKKIGVKINPKVEDFTTLVPKLNSGSNEIETIIIGWQLGNDPDLYSIWHSSNIALQQSGPGQAHRAGPRPELRPGRPEEPVRAGEQDPERGPAVQLRLLAEQDPRHRQAHSRHRAGQLQPGRDMERREVVDQAVTAI